MILHHHIYIVVHDFFNLLYLCQDLLGLWSAIIRLVWRDGVASEGVVSSVRGMKALQQTNTYDAICAVGVIYYVTVRMSQQRTAQGSGIERGAPRAHFLQPRKFGLFFKVTATKFPFAGRRLP
jgi:hypothetical protein